uniref:Secreted protein n=1 Tax=Thraustotheca clavata TaxID=74557 RepID=A0A0A7CL83_9STRA|nr:secreted protein [Thraustotheca clavata]
MVSFTSLLLAATAAFTSAHVSCNPPTAPANGYFVTTIRIPHSFPNAITTNISVALPKNVTSFKPQLVSGWKVDLTYADADKTSLTGVTWYGGELPDALYADFGLQMKLPDVPVGTVFYFPITQTTNNGTLNWTSIPDANGNLPDPSHPSPKVTIVAAATTASTNSSSSTPVPAKSSSNAALTTSAVVLTDSLSCKIL